MDDYVVSDRLCWDATRTTLVIDTDVEARVLAYLPGDTMSQEQAARLGLIKPAKSEIKPKPGPKENKLDKGAGENK